MEEIMRRNKVATVLLDTHLVDEDNIFELQVICLHAKALKTSS